MKRRVFLLSAAALACTPALAQGQKAWRIGVLRAAPDDAVFRENFGPFLPTLRELAGKAEVAVEYRVRPADAAGVLAMANELVGAKVDAILAIATAGVGAAAKATGTVPIVAVDLESDPVGQKFAATLARPGGNVTGVFLDFPELSGKWIQLLKEFMPKLARVAVLYDPAIGSYLLHGAEAAGATMQVQVHRVAARNPADFDKAFESAAKWKAQALLALSSPVFNSARKQIAERAQKHGLPAVMPFPQFADDGGLLAYGPHLTSLFRQAASIMAKVARGARPGDIPIERPTKFELVVNTRTAKALGVTLPPSILVRADRFVG